MQKSILLLVVIFLSACAGIVSPTGGPKDTTPPLCTKQEPKNNTLNFKEKGITFHFNEYVTVNDIINQFIISPPLNENPQITVHGKNIELVFKEDLKPNTTYTLNFGNSIADNNEGNILQGLSYTFSTGNYIDSITLHGTVKDGFTLLPATSVAIGLYKTVDDSTIFKEKPWYLVRPDSSGNFNFKYLSPGQYQIVAFEDINRNLKIEANEKMAYQNQPINLSYTEADSAIHNLLLSPQPTQVKTQLINVKEIAKGKYQIVTTGSNCKIEINSGVFNKNETQLIRKTKNCDTITVYTNNPCEDSTHWSIKVDTVVEKELITCKSKNYNKFILTSNITLNDYNYIKPLQLEFSNPPIEIHQADIELYRDSVQITDYKINNDTEDPLKLNVQYNWQPETKYKIILKKGTIKDLYGQDNDSAVVAISTASTSFFGNLSVVIKNDSNAQYIVQLLNTQNTVVEETTIKQTQTISYQNILPGQYFIKIIEDTNQNNTWDGANYFNKQQPERVYITQKSLEVRANWDVTDITITPEF